MLDLEKFPLTSASLALHIRCADLQIHLWYHCAFTNSVNIKPDDFGYLGNKNKQLIPQITNNSSKPESLWSCTVV